MHYLFIISCYSIYILSQSFVETGQPLEDHYYWNSSDTRRYPWLKFCSDQGQYEIQPGFRCSKGVYFPGGFKPNCVCPFGLWILKTKVCELTTHFLLGDARHDICFLVDFKIESMLFLGDPNNVFASKAYVAPVNLNVFYEIPLDGSFSPLLDLEKPFVIHMFPINNRSIETEDGNCFPMIQPNQVNVPVHIWSSALGATRYRVVDRCSNPLNYGYDELISPNTVFVRSNLIDLNLNVPKPQACTSDLVAKCNHFTTTARPSQHNTPRNHKALYYDLAEISPETVEELQMAQSQVPFHSVEVMPVKEGNLSQMYSDPLEEIDIPVMVGTQTYLSLLNQASQEKEGREGEPNSEEDAWENKSDEHRKDQLVRGIVGDVLRKDSFPKATVMQNLKTQPKWETSPEWNTTVAALNLTKESVENESRTTSGIHSLNLDSGGAQENDKIVGQGQSRKRSINPTELGEVIEEQRGSGFAKKRWQHVMRRRPAFPPWANVENSYPSGLCVGQRAPPRHCGNGGEAVPPIVTGGSPLIHYTNGTMFLMNILETFNAHVGVDDDLRNIVSFADKMGEHFLQFCRIPDSLITPSNFKMAVRIVLAHIPFKVLKYFPLALLKSEKVSLESVGKKIEKCIDKAGKIEFLFKFNKCPVKVSCTKYVAHRGNVTKIITSSKHLPKGKSSKKLLSSIFDSMILSLGLLCLDQMHDSSEIHGLALLKLRRLAVKYDSSGAVWGEGATPHYSENDVQAFLKIANISVYLLNKCKSAVETIFENTGVPSNQMYFPHSSIEKPSRIGKLRSRRSGKVEAQSKRKNHNLPTIRNIASQKELVFDGAGICLNSYSDGFKRGKNNNCFP